MDTTAFGIKTWNEDDRPREKLLLKGKASLSDAELIAIIIGSGNKQLDAVGLSRQILHAVSNNLNELGKQSIERLIAFDGIGHAKAISIVAALELGKRRTLAASLDREAISSSKSVFELLQPLMADLNHEEFWVLYLNNANKILHKEQLSKGGITGTVVDIRLCLKMALQVGAVSIILAHNHPSGTLKPSRADIQLTKKMQKASESLDIKVLDHLIIAEKSYFSFADEHLL